MWFRSHNNSFLSGITLGQFRGSCMESPQYFPNSKFFFIQSEELGHKHFQLPSSLCISSGFIWQVKHARQRAELKISVIRKKSSQDINNFMLKHHLLYCYAEYVAVFLPGQGYLWTTGMMVDALSCPVYCTNKYLRFFLFGCFGYIHNPAAVPSPFTFSSALKLSLILPATLSESPALWQRLRTLPKAPSWWRFGCALEVLYFRPYLKPRSLTHLHPQNTSPRMLGYTSCFPNYMKAEDLN